MSERFSDAIGKQTLSLHCGQRTKLGSVLGDGPQHWLLTEVRRGTLKNADAWV